MKYGKLTVIKEVEPYILPSGQKNKAYLCECECGNKKVIRKLHLVRGRISSCGCIVKTKNGLSTHPLYKVWQAILLRTNGHYKDSYMRKNISVCNEWKEYIVFYNWAIENGYKKGLQIDRIDNYGNYNPSNCRFVTPKQNNRNRENTFKIMYKGKKRVLSDVLDEQNKFNLYNTIIRRIKRGWNAEQAINTDIRKGNYKRKLKE